MKEKVYNFIYLNSNRYLSLHCLQTFYWAIIIFPLTMIAWGIAAIRFIGVNGKSLFPLVSAIVWSSVYWIFVLTVKSKITPKSFALRFLVNGISGILVSALFWCLYTSFILLDGNPIVGFDFAIGILIFYLLFSVLYMGIVVLGVQKGIFRKIRKKAQSPKAISLSAFFSALLPMAGVMGMYTSKILRAYTSITVQNIVGTVALVFVIFIPILAHVNFVQYFYCKKYKISCDEFGNTTSPKLEQPVKAKKQSKEKDLNQPGYTASSSKKKFPLAIKILIGSVCVLIVLLIVVSLIFFIKGFIQGIT